MIGFTCYFLKEGLKKNKDKHKALMSQKPIQSKDSMNNQGLLK
jgi:hypothetical protein